MLALVGGGLGGWIVVRQMEATLPDLAALRAYHPPLVSRIYTADDQLMAELAQERRIFVPMESIPPLVRRAFIAAEDQKFYRHGGIDPAAILRAGITDLVARHGKRPLGASTITQQVVKGMLLNHNSELSLTRKMREALLAMRMEKALSKNRILEIYLNGIYLGNGAYGVEAAAQGYFNKSLDALSPAEAALLAALPKSPTNYNPFLHPDMARDRRNWVLRRMEETGYLTAGQVAEAQEEGIAPKERRRAGPLPDSEWFAEEVRRDLISRYGERKALEGGLDVHTSLDPKVQSVATHALRQGLLQYARRHEFWRGALGEISLPAGLLTPAALKKAEGRRQVEKALESLVAPTGMISTWRMAYLVPVARGGASKSSSFEAIWRERGPRGFGLRQAPLSAQGISGLSRFPLKAGQIVMIEPRADGVAFLSQIPEVEGAAVVMDARTGRILAMSGGWSFRQSQFNRASQAIRQPGSSFKPLVYLAAMEANLSPSQRFDDAPFEQGDWHPQNYEHDNWGPTTLHDALRESRNLVTVRVANHLGMKAVGDIAVRSGMVDRMPPYLPAALGAVETTVLKEAAAYAAIANGGRVVHPTFVDYIQDPEGGIVMRGGELGMGFPSGNEGGNRVQDADSDANLLGQDPLGFPEVTDVRAHLATPQSAYQMATMMRDVIARGTGRRAAPGLEAYAIGGKTGTSQDYRDGWFAGFSPDLVTVVWIGYDAPRSLGRNETGGRVAAPVWNEIMRTALSLRPKLDFPAPEETILARYDTGRVLAVDAFKQGQNPGVSAILHGVGAGTEALTSQDTGMDYPGAAGDSDVSLPTDLPPRDETVQSKPLAPPEKMSQGSDIGLGGLY